MNNIIDFSFDNISIPVVAHHHLSNVPLLFVFFREACNANHGADKKYVGSSS